MTEPEHKRKTQEQKNDKEVFTFVDLSLEESSGSMPMYCVVLQRPKAGRRTAEASKKRRKGRLTLFL